VLVAAPMVFAGVHMVGGSGGTGNTIPWWPGNSSYPQMRFQTIWRQTDIGEAGTITLVEHQAYPGYNHVGGSFTGCRILLCHTTVSTITSTFASNYGGQTPRLVFSGTKVVPRASGGTWWAVLSGSSLFAYNNTNNLLYEVSWTGNTGATGANYITHTRSGQTGRVFAPNATASSGSITAGYGTLARITIGASGVAPTSLGRVKAMYE
jgi:hypothetical protein